jgi:lipid-binding SYLF domain-containing protein
VTGRTLISPEPSRLDRAFAQAARRGGGTQASIAAAALGKSASASTSMTSSGALRKTSRRFPK